MILSTILLLLIIIGIALFTICGAGIVMISTNYEEEDI